MPQTFYETLQNLPLYKNPQHTSLETVSLIQIAVLPLDDQLSRRAIQEALYNKSNSIQVISDLRKFFKNLFQQRLYYSNTEKKFIIILLRCYEDIPITAAEFSENYVQRCIYDVLKILYGNFFAGILIKSVIESLKEN